MPKEIVIKRRTLIGFMLALAGIGLFILYQVLPDLKREIRMMTM